MSQRIRMVIEVAELRYPDDCEKANDLAAQLMQMDEAKCYRHINKILSEAPPVMPAAIEEREHDEQAHSQET